MIRTAPAVVLASAVVLLAGCSTGDPSLSSTAPPPSAPTAPPGEPAPPPVDEPQVHDVQAELSALEAALGAVVGVFALDTGTGDTVEHRADERFAFASTHKAFSAAAVLLGATPEDLDREIPIDPTSIVSYSPVTEPAAGGTLPLRDVLRAAVVESDNTAANLLFTELGGPAGLQEVLRGIGDDVTSVDRPETELNDWAPGEERDTTTPRQAVETLRTFALGDVLDDWARDELLGAMRDVTTADGLIRSAVPADAVVANKSGGAGHGIRADIAVVERPGLGLEPVVIAIFTFHEDPDADWSDELVAEVARIALAALG